MNLRAISEAEARSMNGGKTYRCGICGYTTTSYAKVYANALWCVTKKYGPTVLKITSCIFG